MNRMVGVGLKAFFFTAIIGVAGCGNGSTKGSVSINNGPQEKIVNGVVQPEAASPQVVEIFLNFADGSQGICSGTIIGADSVLTAGHCLQNSPTSIFVKAGGVIFPVSKAYVHPGYFSDPVVFAIFNDVAILKTPPLGLPLMPIGLTQPVEVGGVLMVLGYGLDENKELGTLKVGFSSVEIATPNHIFGPSFDGSNVNPCNGDSGGPGVQTFVSETGESYNAVVGVVSTGTVQDCEEGDMTLYANLQNPALAQFIASLVPDVVFR